jgi:hypothetical protein
LYSDSEGCVVEERACEKRRMGAVGTKKARVTGGRYCEDVW